MTEPLDVLVVGWYPSADDPIAGRFVADQAAALAATGRVRPWAASFEPFWLHGDLSLRTRAADAWPAAVRMAAAEGRAIFPEGAFGPSGVPVVHLGAAAGRSAGAGRDNEAIHRERALQALVDGAGRQVDLIHAHVGYPEGAAAARVAARIGVPLVLTEHATFLARIFANPAHRARYAEAVRSAARVVAVGSALAAQIRAEMPHAAPKLVVIPNTVDVAAFPLQGPDDRDPDELLWVGYRREVKGTGTLLRAFARVRAARPGTVLRLVGRSTTEDEEAGWRQLAAELGIADAVHFDPPADRAGVAAAMARAGLFVHPGTRETFGIVAAEALASGMPVVATDSGGVTEVLGPDPGARRRVGSAQRPGGARRRHPRDPGPPAVLRPGAAPRARRVALRRPGGGRPDRRPVRRSAPRGARCELARSRRGRAGNAGRGGIAARPDAPGAVTGRARRLRPTRARPGAPGLPCLAAARPGRRHARRRGGGCSRDRGAGSAARTRGRRTPRLERSRRRWAAQPGPLASRLAAAPVRAPASRARGAAGARVGGGGRNRAGECVGRTARRAGPAGLPRRDRHRRRASRGRRRTRDARPGCASLAGRCALAPGERQRRRDRRHPRYVGVRRGCGASGSGRELRVEGDEPGLTRSPSSSARGRRGGNVPGAPGAPRAAGPGPTGSRSQSRRGRLDRRPPPGVHRRRPGRSVAALEGHSSRRGRRRPGSRRACWACSGRCCGRRAGWP